MRTTLRVTAGVAIAALTFTVASAQTPAERGAQPATPGTSTSGQSMKTTMSGDQHFAMDTAQVGMAEVEIGTLASEKASNAKVKSFAQQMVTDHSKAGDELKTIAAAKNITLPTTLDVTHQALKDKLSKLSGASFDRTYMDAMVKGHKAASAAFHKEATSGTDAELKSFAAKTVTTVDEHLKMAQDIQKELGVRSSTR